MESTASEPMPPLALYESMNSTATLTGDAASAADHPSQDVSMEDSSSTSESENDFLRDTFLLHGSAAEVDGQRNQSAVDALPPTSPPFAAVVSTGASMGGGDEDVVMLDIQAGGQRKEWLRELLEELKQALAQLASRVTTPRRASILCAHMTWEKLPSGRKTAETHRRKRSIVDIVVARVRCACTRSVGTHKKHARNRIKPPHPELASAVSRASLPVLSRLPSRFRLRFRFANVRSLTVAGHSETVFHVQGAWNT